MRIGEEKRFLYSMMQNITEERNRLAQSYVELLQRLKELNELEKLEQNFYNFEIIPPIDRDMVAEPIPNDSKTLEDYIQIHNRWLDEAYSENLSYKKTADEFKQEEKIPKVEIEKEKDKLPKRSGQLNMDKVYGLITYMLKEKGSPMSVKDIHKGLNERLDVEVKMSNLRNNILPRACKNNPKIQRAVRGYYQYVYGDKY